MKAAGFIRVSTPEQAKEGESLRTQREQVEQYIKMKKGWKLVRIYEDRGRSGAKVDGRQGLKTLMEDAAKKEFEVIIITRFARFARNARDFRNYEDDLKQHGVVLVSIKENIDCTTATGKMLMGVIAEIAEWEREVIREQMSENKLSKWRERRIFNGKVPFGYYWGKERFEIRPDPKEAPVYRKIADMYLNGGMSLKLIALKLRDVGIRSRRGKPFTSSTLSYILRNPAYYGHLVVNQYKYEGSKRTGEIKPADEHIQFPISEPLITKAEWDRIQEKMAFNRVKSKRSSSVSQNYWLRDLLECGECGGVIKQHHGSKRKDGSFLRYYSCYWSTAGPQALDLHNREKCLMPHIKAEQLEADIWEKLTTPLTLGRNKEQLEPLIEPARYDEKIEALESRIRDFERELEKNRVEEENIYSLLKDKDFDRNKLKKRLRQNEDDRLRINGRLVEAEQELQGVREAKANDQLLQDLANNKKDVLNRLSRDLLKLSPEDRKRLAESLIDGKIRVEQGKEYGAKVWYPMYKVRPNLSILKDLMEQGKIGIFNLNSPHHSF